MCRSERYCQDKDKFESGGQNHYLSPDSNVSAGADFDRHLYTGRVCAVYCATAKRTIIMVDDKARIVYLCAVSDVPAGADFDRQIRAGRVRRAGHYCKGEDYDR